MKTRVLSRSYLVNIMKTLLLLSWVLLWVLIQNVNAAGAPARSSRSAAEKSVDANVYFEEGRQLQEAGNYKEAAKKYEKAIKSDPGYAEAWSNLGYSYRKQGYLRRGIKAYKKAIKLDPNLAEAHEYLGETYAEMGKFDLAEKELRILRELGSQEADELEAFIARMKAKS